MGVTTRIAQVNSPISGSPQPVSEPDITAPLSEAAMSARILVSRSGMGRFCVKGGSVGSQK